MVGAFPSLRSSNGGIVERRNHRPEEIDMAKKKVLACTCGDCTHWEIIGVAVTPGAPHDVIFKCKTCGQDFSGKAEIDPHTKLKEIVREV